MTTINPWINFNGNAEEAFTFYKSVLGGEFTKIVHFNDEGVDKIMQITLSLDNSTKLTGNDVPSFMGKTNENENRSKIYVGAESKEEAEKIFKGLSVGGQIEVAPDQGTEGASFSMFRDKYGIEWVVEFNPNN